MNAFNKEEWNELILVGEGGFSKVYKSTKKDGIVCGVKLADSQSTIAIKVISNSSKDEITKETNILKEMDHPKIVKYYGYQEDGNNFYIYTEFVQGNTLDKFIKKLGTSEIYYIIHQILDSLIYVHSRNIIHRDVKCQNIMVDDKTLSIKLIDFGLSTKYDIVSKNYSNIGTETHKAPEVLDSNNKACRKSDVWSLACTILELTGSSLVVRNPNEDIPIIPITLTNELKLFILNCLFIEPNARKSIYQLIKFSKKSFNYQYDYTSDCNINGRKVILNDNNDHLNFPDSSSSLIQEIKILNFNGPFDKINNCSLREKKDKTIKNKFNIKSLNLLNFNDEINWLPKKLEVLKIKSFNKKFNPDCFPNLSTLIMGKDWDFIKNGLSSIPESTKLEINLENHSNSKFQKPRSFKQSLIELKIIGFNQPLCKDFLPPTIKYLTLGNEFNEIDSLLIHLPTQIKYLKFGTNSPSFNQEFIKELYSKYPLLIILIVNKKFINLIV